MVFTVNIDAVFHQPAETGDGLVFIALQRLVSGAQFRRIVLINDQIRAAGSVVRGVFVVFRSVDHQHANGGDGVPGQVDVDGAYHVVAESLRCRRLLAHDLGAPIVGVHVLIGGHNGNIGI